MKNKITAKRLQYYTISHLKSFFVFSTVKEIIAFTQINSDQCMYIHAYLLFYI